MFRLKITDILDPGTSQVITMRYKCMSIDKELKIWSTLNHI